MAGPNDLRRAVREVYSRIADHPGDDHPLPVGRALAEGVGYPADVLDSLPADSAAAFAGVTWIWGFAEITPESVLLDLGCGAGLDSLIASKRAARVIGVDFSTSMLERARKSVAEVGAGNIELRFGDAESIPLGEAAVDCAVVNGIFNLNTSRDQIFRELARVIRPGGRAFVAEIIRTDGSVAPADGGDWFS